MKVHPNKPLSRAAALLIAAVLLLAVLAAPASAATSPAAYSGVTPKYIFLFIGDGMSYPQVTATADYLGKLAYGDEKVSDKHLPFMEFPVNGTATTFDSTSLCPDSASTATAMSTGHKTHSGVINMDETKTTTYTTITEQLKAQLGYKVGVVSSVSIDHATPAAFYAHQPTRSNYYEIGVELVNSGFEYFGGGGFLSPTGKNKDQTDLLQLAADNGYAVLQTKEEIQNFSGDKLLAVNPVLDASMALPYSINKELAMQGLTLAEYTQKGIDVLMNDTGFFMMVEGGKIDWACHANDAAATIADVVALSDAVDVAVAFAAQHPDETLILVTGDHETGGLTIGFAATGYSTYFDKISAQTISYDEFDKTVAELKSSSASFETAMAAVKANYGLLLPTDEGAEANPGMTLTAYEVDRLRQAYGTILQSKSTSDFSEAENVLYGTYNPFSVTVTHILNNKAGLAFTSYSHTGLPVPVFAQGTGEEVFEGYYDDTDIYNRLQLLTGVK